MNREETWALFEQGRDVWNTWAEEMLAKRKKFAENGIWPEGGNIGVGTSATNAWSEEASADFSGQEFNDINTGFADFVFPWIADFRNARFNNQIDFRNAEFNSLTHFENATFKSDANFQNAEFCTNVSFLHASFEKLLDFSSVSVGGILQFANCSLQGRSKFRRAIFRKNAVFSNIRFVGKSDFREVVFGAVASFVNSEFFDSSTFLGASFRAEASFKHATFNDNANFGCVDFQSATHFEETIFKAHAVFYEANFRARTIFTSSNFSQDGTFSRAKFGGPTEFGMSIFEKDAHFGQASFQADAGFGATVFNQSANFSEVEFKEYVTFVRARHIGRCSFRRTRFESTANFYEAVYESDSDFREVVFLSAVNFGGMSSKRGAVFNGSVDFAAAMFLGTTTFMDTSFLGSESVVSFEAAKSVRAFTLRNCTFSSVPDFSQMSFLESPRIDNLQLNPENFRRWHRCFQSAPDDNRSPLRRIISESISVFRWKARSAPNDLAARYRALRRIAGEGHNHNLEQEFFAEELRAQQFKDCWFLHPLFYAIWIYEVLSNFGRSLVRPFFWMAVSLTVFGHLYLERSGSATDSLWENTTMLASAAVSGLTGTEPPLKGKCGKGTGSPARAAVALSVRNSIPFAAGMLGDKSRQIYACLYGTLKIDGRSEPRIPDDVAFWGVVQMLFSAILIFLFGLALRNNFKIG